MTPFIERVALQWFEVQAGRVRVRKGRPSQLKLMTLGQLFENEKLPGITSFWTTRDKCVHFKLNFPHHLRPAVRAIVDP